MKILMNSTCLYATHQLLLVNKQQQQPQQLQSPYKEGRFFKAPKHPSHIDCCYHNNHNSTKATSGSTTTDNKEQQHQHQQQQHERQFINIHYRVWTRLYSNQQQQQQQQHLLQGDKKEINNNNNSNNCNSNNKNNSNGGTFSRFCLLVHGFCSHSHCWRKQIDALLDLHDVIVSIDLPGFGYSSRDHDILHHDKNRGYWAYMLMKHIEREYGGGSESPDSSVKCWTLMAHSMGAKCVAAVCHVWNEDRNQPNFLTRGITHIENVIIVSGASHEVQCWYSSYWIRLLLLITPWWLFSLGAAIVLLGDFICFILLRIAYGSSPSKEDLDAFLHPIRLPNTARGLQRTLTMMGHKEGATMIEMNRYVPRVLLLWGRNDYIVPFSKGLHLYTLLQGDERDHGDQYDKLHEPVQFHVIENCGHCPMETHADEFNMFIKAFIRLQSSTETDATAQCIYRQSGLA